MTWTTGELAEIIFSNTREKGRPKTQSKTRPRNGPKKRKKREKMATLCGRFFRIWGSMLGFIHSVFWPHFVFFTRFWDAFLAGLTCFLARVDLFLAGALIAWRLLWSGPHVHGVFVVFGQQPCVVRDGAPQSTRSSVLEELVGCLMGRLLWTCTTEHLGKMVDKIHHVVVIVHCSP